MKTSIQAALRTLIVAAALLPATLHADTENSWEFGVSINGWFPDLSGKTTFDQGPGGGDFSIGIGDILDNLQFTLQGSFDARKGKWGLFTDAIYMDVGKTESRTNQGTIGGTELPYDLTATSNFDMKSLIWTTAAYYRLIDQPENTFDSMIGLRYIDIEQSLAWSFSGDIGQLPLPGREGSSEVGASYWDFIIGMRGKFAFGQDNRWFIPYYLDIGTGDSDFTWHAAAGIGYAFGWGEFAGVWRYLSYDLPSGKPIADMNFSGPAVGVIFKW